MNPQHNERLKLIASFLNNIATAFTVSGFVVPLLTEQITGAGRLLFGFVCLLLSAGLLILGYALLGGLRS